MCQSIPIIKSTAHGCFVEKVECTTTYVEYSTIHIRFHLSAHACDWNPWLIQDVFFSSWISSMHSIKMIIIYQLFPVTELIYFYAHNTMKTIFTHSAQFPPCVLQACRTVVMKHVWRLEIKICTRDKILQILNSMNLCSKWIMRLFNQIRLETPCRELDAALLIPQCVIDSVCNE